MYNYLIKFYNIVSFYCIRLSITSLQSSIEFFVGASYFSIACIYLAFIFCSREQHHIGLGYLHTCIENYFTLGEKSRSANALPIRLFRIIISGIMHYGYLNFRSDTHNG